MGRVGLAKLDKERVGQGGEEAAGEGPAGLYLADRSGGGRGSGAGVGAVLLFEEREDLAGAVEDRGGHPREARDVDAVALVGAAGHDLVQEDDLAFALADRDVRV